MSTVPPDPSAENQPSDQPPQPAVTPATPPSYPQAPPTYPQTQQPGYPQAPQPQQPQQAYGQNPQQPGYPQAGYPQAGQPYPQGYQRPYTYAAPAKATNVLSILSLVLSLVGVSIGAVITGHISLGQIKKTGEQGHGLAVAGLVLGYIGCALWILFWAFIIVFPIVMGGIIGSVPSGGDYGNYLGS